MTELTLNLSQAVEVGARVLVVDDSPENRYVVKRALTRAGMTVSEASTGAEGEVLAATLPDLIVLDVNLPDMTGFELCHRLKTAPLTSHVPVIHLSQSQVDDNSRVRGLEGGADAYLTDPMHSSVLVATIRALLRMRRAEDRLRQAASDAERLSALGNRMAIARTEDEVITALLDALTDPFVVRRAYLFPARPARQVPQLVYPVDGHPVDSPLPFTTERLSTVVDGALDPETRAERSLYLEDSRHEWTVLPLIAYGREMGTLVIEFADGISLPEHNRRRLEDAAVGCAQAFERARLFEQQRAIAFDLQAGLLPATLPHVEGLKLAAEYQPGAGGTIVGGDFYDVFPSLNGWTAIIGDVCGRGAAAAIRTSLARHTAREAARHDDDPTAILSALERAIHADKRTKQLDLISAVCLRIDVQPEGITVRYAIAGHPLPILMSADGTVSQVGETSPILGFSPDSEFSAAELMLSPGDTLFLYTDGVTESRHSGVLFGEERLITLLEEMSARAANEWELARAPIYVASSYNELNDDDMATLVIRAAAP